MTIRRFALAMTIAVPLLAGPAGCAVEPPAPSSTPLRFEFHSAFLMNLHHFLVDAARHPGRIDVTQWSVPPSHAEIDAMHEAVAFYAATFGQRDLLFDDQLRDIKHALARADDARQQADGLGLPPTLAAMLDRAAPAYARCLWARHDRVNRDWIAQMGRAVPDNLWHAALFEAVGATVSEVLARDGVAGYVEYAQKNGVYQRAWPAYLPLLRNQWASWLDGRASLKEAVDAMLSAPAAPAS